MYDLFIANKNYSSWSLRPWVLMRELDIPFREHLTPFEGQSNRDRFRRFAPNGQVPCLHDDGFAVWDSLAILEFLAERREGVWPADGRARAWARSAAAEMHSGFNGLRDVCSMNCGVRVRLHSIDDNLQRDLDRLDELWRDGLSRFGGPFLAGSTFTAADAMFAPVAFRVQTFDLPLSDAAADYVRRLLDLPSMRQWYEEALAEPWRDQSHDDDIPRVGAVVEDLRSPR